MSEKIKRYDVSWIDHGYDGIQIDMNGGYVKFGDHSEAVQAKDARIAELEGALMTDNPITMVVNGIRRSHLGESISYWECDISVGKHRHEPNDPWLTVSSDQLTRYPKIGDCIQVIPPRVVGFTPTPTPAQKL